MPNALVIVLAVPGVPLLEIEFGPVSPRECNGSSSLPPGPDELHWCTNPPRLVCSVYAELTYTADEKLARCYMSPEPRTHRAVETGQLIKFAQKPASLRDAGDQENLSSLVPV